MAAHPSDRPNQRYVLPEARSNPTNVSFHHHLSRWLYWKPSGVAHPSGATFTVPRKPERANYNPSQTPHTIWLLPCVNVSFALQLDSAREKHILDNWIDKFMSKKDQ